MSDIISLDLATLDSHYGATILEKRATILSSIQTLSPSDRARFALYGIGPSMKPRFRCIHEAFSYWCKRQPNATAAEHLDQKITFEKLDYLSSVLANVLRARGISQGSRVCLLIKRSIAMVVAILGILKADASYVPLDGGIVTDAMLRFVVKDSGATIVLSLSEFRHRIPSRVESICLETVMDENLCLDAASHSTPYVSNREAYIIYTSGSTGLPKGVSVTHGNLTNLLCLSPGRLGMRPGARVAQLLNIAFDMCAWEVLGSLTNGCTLCIRGKTKDQWKALLKTVDVVISTPTILQCYDPTDFSNIRCIATAGEPCPQSLADSWSKTANFYNSCGPTEITIVNTVQAHKTGEPVSIGHPTPNNSVYVLDENMQPVPIGQSGIIWASGAGVSSGYVNLPGLTAQRFLLDRFTNDGSLMFNTGDLGRWNSKGQLEHLGRQDDQVKIKGFRVELDGVAAAMQSCTGVTHAVALLIGQDLLGFVCPADIDLKVISEIVSSILPYYAVPAKYICLNGMPMTSNGKVDKAVLRSFVRATACLDTAHNEDPALCGVKLDPFRVGGNLQKSNLGLQRIAVF